MRALFKLHQDAHHVKLAGLWLLIIISQKMWKNWNMPFNRISMNMHSPHSFIHSRLCPQSYNLLMHTHSWALPFSLSGLSEIMGPFRWSGIQHGSFSCRSDMQREQSGPAQQELLRQWWEWASGLGPSGTPPLGTKRRRGRTEQMQRWTYIAQLILFQLFR